MLGSILGARPEPLSKRLDALVREATQGLDIQALIDLTFGVFAIYLRAARHRDRSFHRIVITGSTAW
jgi:hypothetical protein